MREKKIQEKLTILNLNHGIISLLLKKNEACGKPHAGETAESSTAFQKSQKNKEATVGHFIAISPQTISYTEAVYDIVRKTYGRPSDDPMEYLIVNMALW